MKRIISLLLTFISVLGLASCGSLWIEVDLGESEIYSEEERREVADMLLSDPGYTYKIRYAGDGKCQAELEIANKHQAPGEEYIGCIVFFESVIIPPGGMVHPEGKHEDYFIEIYAKTQDGEWKRINGGTGI